MTICERLFELQDQKYRSFQSKLIPNIDPAFIIGVRLPYLREIAKEIADVDIGSEFINTLPHKYLEEYHIHSFIIAKINNFDKCIYELEKFLPYVDNWAVCDSLRPKCFNKNRDRLIIHIKKWIKSKNVYTVRFAIEMLMLHYLDEDFSRDHLELVSLVDSNDYYVKMMVAWYFATALAKQYEAALIFIESNGISDIWIHNKSIQKALESYRIDPEHKEYLKGLKKHIFSNTDDTIR